MKEIVDVVARWPPNGRRGLERGLILGYWVLRKTFAKYCFLIRALFVRGKGGEQAGAELGQAQLKLELDLNSIWIKLVLLYLLSRSTFTFILI